MEITLTTVSCLLGIQNFVCVNVFYNSINNRIIKSLYKSPIGLTEEEIAR